MNLVSTEQVGWTRLCDSFSDFAEDQVLWRRWWHPTPVLLPGKSLGWRSLVGCSPWGREELDTTERLHFHSSLSCFGEGNGNPLQCSCLENPRDGGGWWAAVFGVTQSRTWLKWLSSSKYFEFRSGVDARIGDSILLDLGQDEGACGFMNLLSAYSVLNVVCSLSCEGVFISVFQLRNWRLQEAVRILV